MPPQNSDDSWTPGPQVAMNLVRSEPAGLNLSLSDIYYVIFRHKLKIVTCSILGVAAAAGFYFFVPRVYKSDAKLLVRYVTESRAPAKNEENSSVRNPDPLGYSILTSEIEIIKSLDLAGEVADAIGVNALVKKPLNDGRDHERARYAIAKGLVAENPSRSSIIQLTFTHEDATLVQPVLRETIKAYLKKHAEIHRAGGFADDFLAEGSTQLRTRLSKTEEELRVAKSKLGYPSVEEANRTISGLYTRLRQEISDSETEAAQQEAYIQSLEGVAKQSPDAKPTETIDSAPVPSSEATTRYTALLGRLASLRKTEQEVLTQFTPESSRAKDIAGLIQTATAELNKLEAEEPGLKPRRASLAQAADKGVPRPLTTDLNVERARLSSVRSKVASLKDQLAELNTEAARVNSMESEIMELTRRKNLEETNYLKYASHLEQARINDATSTGNVSNISEIQSPSFPDYAKSKRIYIIPGLALGGFALGLAWAFLIEFYLDRSIRRPIDIQRKLHLPLFLNVPRLGDKAIKALPAAPNAAKAGTSTALTAPKGTSDGAVAQALQPFFATLRDRVISFCESRGLTHKPKLIAVTGINADSGVSTTAFGIAQSLSETGEGNVLLVNMNPGQDAAHQFYQGQAVNHLDDLLEQKRPDPVQENLYVVTEGSKSDLLLRNLPQRFSKILPKLKTSDFDYIIFDMPPVNQISITPRLSSFMDVVLLLVESEKTDLEVAQQATALLSNPKQHVAVVLNKTRSYIPPALDKERGMMLGN